MFTPHTLHVYSIYWYRSIHLAKASSTEDWGKQPKPLATTLLYWDKLHKQQGESSAQNKTTITTTRSHLCVFALHNLQDTTTCPIYMWTASNGQCDTTAYGAGQERVHTFTAPCAAAAAAAADISGHTPGCCCCCNAPVLMAGHVLHVGQHRQSPPCC
jgi:hypothetical protein